MAWTAPATWSVAEVVTASKMNTHIKDNLRYLKGLDGAVIIQDDMSINTTTAPNGPLMVVDGSRTNADANSGVGGFRLATGTGASTDESLIFGVLNGGYSWIQAVKPGTANRDLALNASGGNVGIGTTVPQGRIHAVGVGGSFVFLSGTAINSSATTLAVNGTVTQSAAFWGYDRNNTGGGFVQVSGNMLGISQTFNMVNTDTITISVTASGAITAQRTAGSNGTHEVNFMVLLK